MDQFMNEPVEKRWTDEEIIREYEKIRDKKKLAKIFCLTRDEICTILEQKKTAQD